MELPVTINVADVVRSFTTLFVLCSTSMAYAQGTKSIDAVRAAWSSRAEKLRSLTVNWAEETTTPTGMAGRNNKGGPVPERDVTHSVRHRFLSDGKRIYWSRSGLQWDMDTSDFIQKDFTRSFDGNEKRELFADPTKTNCRSSGFQNDNGIFDGGDWHLQPPVLTYRPLNVSMGGIDLSSWGISERHSMVHKVPCWALELQRGSSVVETLWLAVTPDFRIMRRDLAAGSALLKQLTIDYEERADTGFACKAWSFIRFLEDGRISESSVVSNAVASVNPSIASSEFDFQFPPGTLVRLERSKKWAVARRDGTLRPVSEGELSAGISLVTLMETPPLPETTVGHASKLSTFRILVIVVAGCVLLLWWRCRRKTEA